MTLSALLAFCGKVGMIYCETAEDFRQSRGRFPVNERSHRTGIANWANVVVSRPKSRPRRIVRHLELWVAIERRRTWICHCAVVGCCKDNNDKQPAPHRPRRFNSEQVLIKDSQTAEVIMGGHGQVNSMLRSSYIYVLTVGFIVGDMACRRWHRREGTVTVPA